MFFSPLEQFQILPIFQFSVGSFDFSITNGVIILFLGLAFFFFMLNSLLINCKSFAIVPNRIQIVVESIYSVTYSLLEDNVGKSAKSFFPYIFTLFTFIVISNVIGLVGTRMCKVADQLAEATGWGEAVVGDVFLGGSTS